MLPNPVGTTKNELGSGDPDVDWSGDLLYETLRNALEDGGG